MPNLLVELRTEELPVAALDVIYSELARKVAEVFQKNHLRFKQVLVEATPRRIAVFVEGLSAKQDDQVLEFSGPSSDKAYDADGKPTPALLGFLKSKNAGESEIKMKETPRGKFVSIQKKAAGRPTRKVLPQGIVEIFTNLPFPKNMRWEKSGFRFPRPIRGMVAYLDKKTVPIEIAGISSGRTTLGHRFLAAKPVVIAGADWKAYEKSLRHAHVILRLEERKKILRSALAQRFKQKTWDEELIHMDAQLAEEPFLIEGRFSQSYLDLPAEVLASCMKKNQKIFALYDAKGKLTGRFAAVLNGRRRGLPQIQAGYQNVLESRLRDARYFYEADTKEPLEKKLPLLDQVTYLGKLGTMGDKTRRLEKLAEPFAAMVGREDLTASLKRTARLAKIDLMTQLVYEFPDLQGIVGREYARESGEKEEVARAIGEQYLPKGLGENFQSLAKELSPLGVLFGIMDRLDHLVGAFGTGLQPTGSQDPYALRRAGGTIVKLVRAFRFPFYLKEAIESGFSLYGNKLNCPAEEVTGRLLGFFQERVIFEIQAKPGGRPYEILQAVFRSSFDSLADVFGRYEILSRLYERDPETLIRTAKVVERTANILKGVKGGSPLRPELYKERSERRLFELLNEHSGEIQDFLKRRDYEKATSRFGEIFYLPLHDFFKEVMVNVEDAALRESRQALVREINQLYTKSVADLSVLSGLDRG